MILSATLMATDSRLETFSGCKQPVKTVFGYRFIRTSLAFQTKQIVDAKSFLFIWQKGAAH